MPEGQGTSEPTASSNTPAYIGGQDGDERKDLLGSNFTLRDIVERKGHTASGRKPGKQDFPFDSLHFAHLQ